MIQTIIAKLEASKRIIINIGRPGLTTIMSCMVEFGGNVSREEQPSITITENPKRIARTARTAKDIIKTARNISDSTNVILIDSTRTIARKTILNCLLVVLDRKSVV